MCLNLSGENSNKFSLHFYLLRCSESGTDTGCMKILIGGKVWIGGKKRTWFALMVGKKNAFSVFLFKDKIVACSGLNVLTGLWLLEFISTGEGKTTHGPHDTMLNTDEQYWRPYLWSPTYCSSVKASLWGKLPQVEETVVFRLKGPEILHSCGLKYSHTGGRVLPDS